MADNKPERKKSPLYNERGTDKPRAPEGGEPSKGKDAGKEKEPKGESSGGARAKESGKPHDKDAGKMKEPGGSDEARAPESGTPGAGDIHARHNNEREEMHGRHRTERRDMHGNHRAEHDKMHGRHQKEHDDMAKRHTSELTAASGPTDGLQEGGEAAMGAQAPGAGGEPTVQATEAA